MGNLVTGSAIALLTLFGLFGDWYSNSDSTLYHRAITEELKRAELIDTFYARVGIRETCGNNCDPAIQRMLECCGLYGEYPWCGALGCEAYKQCDLNPPRGSCGSYNWADEDKRVWNPNNWKGNPRPGDMFTLYYSYLGRIGHVGVVVKRKGVKVKTIEGNTNEGGSREGDGVMRKTRQLKNLEGIYDHVSYQID